METTEHTFKPFEKILVRQSDLSEWHISLFSHQDDDHIYTVNGLYNQCIPYEGNEHLLGTTNSPTPKLKFGDKVRVLNENHEWVNGIFVRMSPDEKSFGVYTETDNSILVFYFSCEPYDW